MMYSNRVCQKLHDEHMATLGLLERLERFFVAKQEPPAAIDSATRIFLIDLAVAFESEVWHHFDFDKSTCSIIWSPPGIRNWRGI